MAFVTTLTRLPTTTGQRTARCGRRPGISMNSSDEKPKNPLGGLGGIGNIMDAMKKAQQFTSVAKDLQTELANTEIETNVRDGEVKVILTAQQKPVRVEIAPELVAKGADEVSAAVTEAFITAHAKSSQYMKEKMGALTKDFGLPTPPAQ